MDGFWITPRMNTVLFYIFLADLFFIVKSMDITNYADYNMPYSIANDIDNLIVSLEEA